MKFMGKVMMLLLLVVTVSVGSIEVFANQVNQKSAAEEYIRQVVKVENGQIVANNSVVRTNVSMRSGGGFDRALSLPSGETIYYRSSAEGSIYAQSVRATETDRVGDKVNDITSGLGIEANTGAASTILGGFTPFLELIIGIIVVAITLGMTLFTSMDMAYIAFPTFRNKAETAKQGGGQGGFGAGMVKKDSNGESKFRWITDEAVYAVEAGTMDSGQSPWIIYLKKRVAAYIFLSMVLVILLTGNISIITSIAVNVVNGIMNILVDLAA